jgi:hypothetical protein
MENLLMDCCCVIKVGLDLLAIQKNANANAIIMVFVTMDLVFVLRVILVLNVNINNAPIYVIIMVDVYLMENVHALLDLVETVVMNYI